MPRKGNRKTFSNPSPPALPDVFRKKTKAPRSGGIDRRDTDKDNPKKISAPQDPSGQ